MAGRIGGMDQRVTFQSETLVSDGQGGNTSSGWASIASTPTMWARVAPSRGSEDDHGEARQANTYALDVTVRNRADITVSMTLLWRGLQYNIRSVDPYNPRSAYLKLICEGGVAL